MSDLIVSHGFSYSKDDWTFSPRGGTTAVALTGTGVVANRQTVGFAAHEALVLGEVATPGWGWFLNCDGTNFVEIGYDTAGTFRPVVKLLAGDPPAQFRFSASAAAPYAKADTGAVKLAYIITEV
jgi:hypothetical protein